MSIDKLETRKSEERENALLRKLSDQVQFAKQNTEYFGRIFANIDPLKINGIKVKETIKDGKTVYLK